MSATKNCVVYLLKATDAEVFDFWESLIGVVGHLVPYLNSSYTSALDIVIFHESNLTNAQKAKYEGTDLQGATLKYHQVTFDYELGTGIQHANRFLSGLMYKESIMDDYEYYLKLDCNSFLMANTNGYGDWFEWMQRNNCEYGYINDTVRDGGTHLYNASGLAIANKMYYSNFELGKVSFFQSSAYQNFWKSLDDQGGFFSNDWYRGQATYLGVQSQMNSSKIKAITGIMYEHNAIYDDS